MSQEYCWECGDSYSRNELFDIPIFNKNHTVKWCFNCAMKQLKLSDYRLTHNHKLYIPFRILSCEDRVNQWVHILSELEWCYSEQFGEIDDYSIWNKLQLLAGDIHEEEKRG